MKRFGRARQAKDDNIPVIRGRKYTICMPGNWQEYRRPIIIFTTYCFSTANVVTRTSLNIRLHHIACLAIQLNMIIHITAHFFHKDIVNKKCASIYKWS